jgi:hypothetical protein
MCLLFTIAAVTCQQSHSQVRLPRDSWPHFTVSNSRLSQPGGPGPRIYIPQEQVGPVIAPGTGFPFRRLLRLAGLRWRYSTPPPHGIIENTIVSSRHYRTDHLENTASQPLHCCMLRICCLATGVFAEPLLSNGCLCWLHSSWLEQICHSFYSQRTICLVL